MNHPTRRRFLGVLGAASVVTAGCIGDDDDETPTPAPTPEPTPDEPELPQGDLPRYIEWVPSFLTRPDEFLSVVHMDVQSVIKGWPAEFVDNFGFDTLTDEIGVESDDLDGMLFTEPEDLELESTVMLGSFDPDHVVETLSPDEPAEADDGFQVIGGFIAVDEEALIISNQYESFIEAGVAGGYRMIDEYEHWERAAKPIEIPDLAMIEHNPDDAQDLLAMAIYRIEDGFDITGYAFFADGDTAEAEIDDLEAAIEEELDTGEITDIYRIENVIVAEDRAGEDFLRI